MKNIKRGLEYSKHIWQNAPILVFTIDVDWASEDAIALCCELLEHYGILPTLFLTHPSDFIYEKLEQGRIDAGIHPNFASGSSQGNSYTEVMDYCLNILPNAECFRCHRYYDVNDITDSFYARGLRYDSNMCTLLEKIDPFVHRSGLLRFPVYFEDGAYLLHKGNLNYTQVGGQLFSLPGLMVINIHPMHMVLNSPHFSYARVLKNRLTRKEWNSLTNKDFGGIQYLGPGIRDFIINLLKFVYKNNIKTYTLKQLHNEILALKSIDQNY